MGDLQVAEVRSGLYFGSADVVNNHSLLKSAGITHVINLVSEDEIARDRIQSHPEEFTYCNLPMYDFAGTRIIDYFEQTHTFIEAALRSGGRVFVHCNRGRSRAATIIVAYLMRTENLGANHALVEVGKIRFISPNDGFIRQLHEYEARLRGMSKYKRMAP